MTQRARQNTPPHTWWVVGTGVSVYNEAMRYQGTVNRPPSEAHNYILQVTLGCSRRVFRTNHASNLLSMRLDLEIRQQKEAS